MSKCGLLLACILLFGCSPSRSKRGKRELFVKQEVARLRQYALQEDVVFCEPEIADGKVCYSIFPRGTLRLANNGWFHVSVQSFHLPPCLGDIVLAVDNAGSIYQADTHACQSIEMVVDVSGELPTLQEVLACTFWIDGKKGWQEYKPEQPDGAEAAGAAQR